MPKLETRGLVFDDKIDADGEMEIETAEAFLFVNKEEAIQIIKHFQELFNI